MNRILQFDYIRVVSLLGILLCHSLFESVHYGWLGRYLALTFNFIFLVLSAFLFGLTWTKNGRPAYDRRFLKKRFTKLSRTYYPYLVALFIFLYISQDYFSPRNIISHFAYLPWFDKVEGFGHLWFMTMIMICYACIWILTKFVNARIHHKILIYSLLIGGGYLHRFHSDFPWNARLSGALFDWLYFDFCLCTCNNQKCNKD